MFRAWETLGALGTGINTTTEQVDWLRGEIDAPRPGRQALRCARPTSATADAQYDKVVSIGVLEHAGRDQLAEVIQAHADFLKPGGLGMLHFIGHVGPRETELFIRKHVFPGGWIPGLAEVIVEMERCGLEVLDIENLRRHYALDAGRVGPSALSSSWDGDPGAGPAALRRTLSPGLAHLPDGLRRNVPLAGGLHPFVPDRLQQGQRDAGPATR